MLWKTVGVGVCLAVSAGCSLNGTAAVHPVQLDVRNATDHALLVEYCPPITSGCTSLGLLAAGEQQRYDVSFDPRLASFDYRVLVEAFEPVPQGRRLVARVPVFLTTEHPLEVILAPREVGRARR